MVETPWYFRLFYIYILIFVIHGLLFVIIKAKRMELPAGKSWIIVALIGIILGWALMWFVSFSINPAFWIGLVIIVFGKVVLSLGYIAMREHPEKKKIVVDWGIYKVSRHSHVLAGIICLLGVIVMGWNPTSVMYKLLWVYFAIYSIATHFYVLSEEKVNIEKFGQEYVDYMNKTPRYIGIPKSAKKGEKTFSQL
ncbi:MAG: isoprenylcysteine carboxylmethyltransferase family protein [bacterium]